MTSVVCGIVFTILGAWGLLYWMSDFFVVLRGFGPISLFVGGIISLLVGIASMRPKRGDDAHKD